MSPLECLALAASHMPITWVMPFSPQSQQLWAALSEICRLCTPTLSWREQAELEGLYGMVTLCRNLQGNFRQSQRI